LRKGSRSGGGAPQGPAVCAAAQGTAWRFAARALSGFSTGLASGAATAWIAELYAGGKSDGKSGGAARIASAANIFGCAAGPLIGGLFAQFAPAPLRLCYFAYLVLVCGAAGAVLVPRETVAAPEPLREVSPRPRLRRPPG